MSSNKLPLGRVSSQTKNSNRAQRYENFVTCARIPLKNLHISKIYINFAGKIDSTPISSGRI